MAGFKKIWHCSPNFIATCSSYPSRQTAEWSRISLQAPKQLVFCVAKGGPHCVSWDFYGFQMQLAFCLLILGDSLCRRTYKNVCTKFCVHWSPWSWRCWLWACGGYRPRCCACCLGTEQKGGGCPQIAFSPRQTPECEYKQLSMSCGTAFSRVVLWMSWLPLNKLQLAVLLHMNQWGFQHQRSLTNYILRWLKCNTYVCISH